MQGRGLNLILGVYVALIFTFVFAPIFFSLVFSFNSQRFPTIPLGNFSTEWYAKILTDPDIWQAVRNSVIVSVSTALLATTLGFCTAYTDFRYNFRFKGPYLALILLPPTIPLIIMALAMLAWLSRLGLSGQLWSIIMAHSVLTAPFAMAIIRLRLHQMDPDLEAAAWNLGGTEWQAMRHVIVPNSLPEIFTGARVAMGVCWGTVVAAELVAAEKGAGKMIIAASKFQLTDIVIMGIILIGVIGYGIDILMRIGERYLVPWKGRS